MIRSLIGALSLLLAFSAVVGPGHTQSSRAGWALLGTATLDLAAWTFPGFVERFEPVGSCARY